MNILNFDDFDKKNCMSNLVTIQFGTWKQVHLAKMSFNVMMGLSVLQQLAKQARKPRNTRIFLNCLIKWWFHLLSVSVTERESLLRKLQNIAVKDRKENTDPGWLSQWTGPS